MKTSKMIEYIYKAECYEIWLDGREMFVVRRVVYYDKYGNTLELKVR